MQEPGEAAGIGQGGHELLRWLEVESAGGLVDEQFSGRAVVKHLVELGWAEQQVLRDVRARGGKHEGLPIDDVVDCGEQRQRGENGDTGQGGSPAGEEEGAHGEQEQERQSRCLVRAHQERDGKQHGPAQRVPASLAAEKKSHGSGDCRPRRPLGSAHSEERHDSGRVQHSQRQRGSQRD